MTGPGISYEFETGIMIVLLLPVFLILRNGKRKSMVR